MRKFLFLIFALSALFVTTTAFMQQEPTAQTAAEWEQATVIEAAPSGDVYQAEATLASDGTMLPQANDLLDFFAMFGALLPLVVSITAFLVARFTLKPTAKQLMAWGVSIGLSFAGWWLKIGYLTDITWWMALIHGVALGLAANGFFDIAIIKALLNAIFPPAKK